MIRTDNAKELLKNSGLRSTNARVKILEYLIENPTHPNTEELKHALNEVGDKIPTATLYQSLEKLITAGLLLKFPGTDGQVRYDANLKYHHHLICTSCNSVVDIHLPTLLSEFAIDKEGLTGWEINKEQIELRGICPRCKENKGH